MKCTTTQLQHQTQLSPIYLISGDEPILADEAKRAVLKLAKLHEFDVPQRIDISSHFDWNELTQALSNISLFNTKNFIFLRSDHLKFGKIGSILLQDIAKGKFSPNLVLMLTPKCDQAAQRTAWFQAILTHACFVPIWPIATQQWPTWLQQRLQRSKLTLEPDAFKILCEHLEGQLIVAIQLIEQLRLSYGQTNISKEQVSTLLIEHGTYDIFQLCDQVLTSNVNKALKILAQLQQSGIEPVLVLWALTRDIRTLISLIQLLDCGQPLLQAFKQARIWQQRQNIMKTALKNHNKQRCYQFLQHASRIDQIIKGLTIGNVWDELTQLCLAISTHRILSYA